MAQSKNDWTDPILVKSFETAELVFPSGSVIGLRLHDSAQETVQSGSAPAPHKFVMASDRARRLAERLIALADEIDGVGQPRN